MQRCQLMAVTVVLHHPRRHLLRRAWRQFGAFCGGTLLVVGILAALVAVPTTLAVATFVVGRFDEPAPGEEPWPRPDWPVDEIVLAWVASTLLAIVGLILGRRLLRGERELVLFLRRFGYDEATKAVTYAAIKTVGGSWRLVTLDDKEIAPLGVPTGPLRLFGAGRRAYLGVRTVAKFNYKRAYALTLGAIGAIAAIELLRRPDRRASLNDGTFDPYLDTLRTIATLHPIDALGLSLQGLFAALVILLALEVAVMAVTFAVMLLWIPLAPVFLLLRTSADAVEKAEAAKMQWIHREIDIPGAAQSVLLESGKVFAPRLVVVKVGGSVWQQTVEGFAAVCSALLIDLSDVSENVLWEVEAMTRSFGRRCLFVGQHDRVAWLADPPPGLGAAEERLLRLVDGHQVLAYTTDRTGTRRFARSLRASLLTVTGDMARTSTLEQRRD